MSTHFRLARSIPNRFASAHVGLYGVDMFAAADPIPLTSGGEFFESIPTTASFTTETDEPNPLGGSYGKSAWWKFIAPANGYITADTSVAGAGNSPDTVLAFYRGTAINALTKLASDDDSGNGWQSYLSAFVAAGQTYYIQAAGLGGSTATPMNMRFQYAPDPPNDNFANAIAVTISSGNTFTDGPWNNRSTSIETGEPTAVSGTAGVLRNTIWYSYTPASSGVAVFDLVNTWSMDRNNVADSGINLYVGNSVSTLSRLASDDSGSSGRGKISYNVVAGTKYYIQVGCYGLSMAYVLTVTGPDT